MLQFENYFIEEVDKSKEVNYLITDKDGYVCTLVPGYEGFELSANDKALDINPGKSFVYRISEFIVSELCATTSAKVAKLILNMHRRKQF